MFFVFLNSKWYFSRKGLTTGQISFLSGNGMIKGEFFEKICWQKWPNFEKKNWPLTFLEPKAVIMVVRTKSKIWTIHRSVSYHGPDFLGPIFKHGSPVNDADFLVRTPTNYLNQNLDQKNRGQEFREKTGFSRKIWSLIFDPKRRFSSEKLFIFPKLDFSVLFRYFLVY